MGPGVLAGAADLGDALMASRGCSSSPSCSSSAGMACGPRQPRGRVPFSGAPAHRLQHSSGSVSRPVAAHARRQGNEPPLRDPEARFRR
jgi:hypothetical protein